MKKCELTDVAELAFSEEEPREGGPNEVLVAVDAVGICGSDLHYYQHGGNAGNEVPYPHVLGHEAAGTVAAVGERVTDLEAGDRVAIEPGIPCDECAYCEAGEYHLCPEMEYMSSPPVEGALVEYVVHPAEYVYRLPDDVSLREGALVEPLSVAIHACERADISEGDSVLVTGGGPIGLLVAEVARAKGAGDVVLTDVVKEKLDLASERGVDHAVDVTERDPVDVIRERVDERGVDVVIESSGAESAIETTPDAVRRGGTIVFVGIPQDAPLPADVVETINQEYELKGSYRFSGTYSDAIRGIAEGRYDVDGIVSFERPFAATESAFERALEPDSVKGVVRVSE